MRRLPAPALESFLLGLNSGLRSIGAVLDGVAASPSTVLLLGETGTGKELLAREIHARSPRAGRPLVAVNCAAYCDGLLESELFGHEQGSFTGAQRTRVGRLEAADGGTLFLDEVGEMPVRAQTALLRFLQEREFERVGSNQTRAVDVRVVAATNVNLEERVRGGSFREDLFYRLNVVRLFVPPLRERREDIPLLAHAFLEEFTRELGKEATLTDAALDSLLAYPWPGNARELRNAVERAVVLAEPGGAILPSSLGLALTGPPDGAAITLVQAIKADAAQNEVHSIAEALRAAGGNKADAARRLGIPRTTLHDSLRRLKLG